MNEYYVTITETLSKTYRICADTRDEAKEIVNERYYTAKDDKYILGAEDLTGFCIDVYDIRGDDFIN